MPIAKPPDFRARPLVTDTGHSIPVIIPVARLIDPTRWAGPVYGASNGNKSGEDDRENDTNNGAPIDDDEGPDDLVVGSGPEVNEPPSENAVKVATDLDIVRVELYDLSPYVPSQIPRL